MFYIYYFLQFETWRNRGGVETAVSRYLVIFGTVRYGGKSCNDSVLRYSFYQWYGIIFALFWSRYSIIYPVLVRYFVYLRPSILLKFLKIKFQWANIYAFFRKQNCAVYRVTLVLNSSFSRRLRRTKRIVRRSTFDQGPRSDFKSCAATRLSRPY